MRFLNSALGLTLAGVGLFAAVPARADDSAHDQVERLMPQLMSKDEEVRRSAEKEACALGPAGRAEFERIACDEEPRRAITALRMLSCGAWPDAKARERRMGSDAPAAEGAGGSSDDMLRELADLRRRMREIESSFGWAPEQFEWPDGKYVRAKASGEVVENDRKLTWSIDEDGAVKVTTKDGKDAPERTFDAKNLAELREKDPEVAKRLEAVLPRSPRRLSFRLEPEFAPSDGTEAPAAPSDRRVTPDMSQPVLGIEWSPLPEVMCDQFDVKGGLVVESVVAGTLAEKLGLERHDVLLEIAGKPVNGSMDVRTALDIVKPGDKVTAVVLRAGQRRTLETTK